MHDISTIPRQKIRRALRRFPNNLTDAARRLKVERRALAELVFADPDLLDQANEANECALDRSEAQMREALSHPDPAKRIAAASFIVRSSARWRNP